MGKIIDKTITKIVTEEGISLFKGDNSISVRKADCSALRRMYFIFSEAIIL